MPTENGGKPATQVQLQAVEQALKDDVGALRSELKAVEQTLKADIHGLDRKIDRVAVEVVKHSGRFDALEQTLRKEMTRGFERVTKTIDSFLSDLQTYARESVTIPRTLDAHGERLKDHERRLSVIESKS
ncbi:MAG: hypothetical protein ABII00_16260 [Elusimicrobiota bacterium]